jgi:TrmH family RNA methyltransferase
MTNISNFQKINSSQNYNIKMLKKLALKKYRHEFDSFTVENQTIIFDALESRYDFDFLFVTQDFINKHADKIGYFLKNSKCKNYYIIDEKINKHFSQLDTPSGICAVYKIKNKELTEESVIYLNRVSDPGNLGAIMRSALAFGFDNLVLDKNCADIYSPKTISAARDAIFKLNIQEDKEGVWLEKNKLPIYITSSHKGEGLSEFKPNTRFCLALGNESHGISSEIEKISDKIIQIEMTSNIESLNVASAAAILFYELRKKQVMPEGH